MGNISIFKRKFTFNYTAMCSLTVQKCYFPNSNSEIRLICIILNFRKVFNFKNIN